LLRKFVLLLSLVGASLFAVQDKKVCDANNVAKAHVCIELRGSPDPMEPESIPTLLKVDNQTEVVLRVVNISPLDSCSTTGVITPTTISNPFSQLLSLLAGPTFGSLAIGSEAASTVSPAGGNQPSPAPPPVASAELSLHSLAASPTVEGHQLDALITVRRQTSEKLLESFTKISEDLRKKKGKIETNTSETALEKDIVYKQFSKLAAAEDSSFNDVFTKLKDNRDRVDKAAKQLLSFVSDDYRGKNWSAFKPSTDRRLEDVRDLSDHPIATIGVVSATQGDLDSLKAWGKYLHDNYDFGNKATGDELKTKQMDLLRVVDTRIETGTNEVAILTEMNTALNDIQTALRASYTSANDLFSDFEARLEGSLKKEPSKPIKQSLNRSGEVVLYRDFMLAREKRETDLRTLTCVTYVDQKTPTLNAVNFPILYQSLPIFSMSPGVLMTFREKYNLGITNTTDQSGNNQQIFGVTDRARLQVFPMAFVNLRIGPRKFYLPIGSETHPWFLLSGALTGGIGVNSNSGTNQVEFFVGPSMMFGKLIVSPGVHYGRVQSIGGGYSLNQTLPSNWPGSNDTVPINWKYKPAFSIGFSFRTYPW
jgi:hypothetical protein